MRLAPAMQVNYFSGWFNTHQFFKKLAEEKET